MAATVSYGWIWHGKSLCNKLLPFMFDFRRGSTEAQYTEQCCVIVNSPRAALSWFFVLKTMRMQLVAGLSSKAAPVEEATH